MAWSIIMIAKIAFCLIIIVTHIIYVILFSRFSFFFKLIDLYFLFSLFQEYFCIKINNFIY